MAYDFGTLYGQVARLDCGLSRRPALSVGNRVLQRKLNLAVACLLLGASAETVPDTCLVYVTTSRSTMSRAVASASTWNSNRSARVFYFFGKADQIQRIHVEAIMTQAGVLLDQLVFLPVPDTRPELKDLAIWTFAWEVHMRAHTSVRWFLRIDDDTFLFLPRLHGLLQSLDCHASRVFVGGTPNWIADSPKMALQPFSGKTVFEWGGRPLYIGGTPDPEFFREQRFGRAPLPYCTGGPGTLVSRAAVQLGRGFGSKCAASIANLEKIGCGIFVGNAASWIAKLRESGIGLGHGEAGSWVHRLVCLRAALRPGTGGFRRLPVARFRPYVDALFAYCLETQHSRLLRCQRIAWLTNTSSRKARILSVLEPDSANVGRVRGLVKYGLPAHLVSVHGIKLVEDSRALNKRYALAHDGVTWPPASAGQILVLETREHTPEQSGAQPAAHVCAGGGGRRSKE